MMLSGNLFVEAFWGSRLWWFWSDSCGVLPFEPRLLLVDLVYFFNHCIHCFHQANTKSCQHNKKQQHTPPKYRPIWSALPGIQKRAVSPTSRRCKNLNIFTLGGDKELFCGNLAWITQDNTSSIIPGDTPPLFLSKIRRKTETPGFIYMDMLSSSKIQWWNTPCISFCFLLPT